MPTAHSEANSWAGRLAPAALVEPRVLCVTGFSVRATVGAVVLATNASVGVAVGAVVVGVAVGVAVVGVAVVGAAVVGAAVGSVQQSVAAQVVQVVEADLDWSPPVQATADTPAAGAPQVFCAQALLPAVPVSYQPSRQARWVIPLPPIPPEPGLQCTWATLFVLTLQPTHVHGLQS